MNIFLSLKFIKSIPEMHTEHEDELTHLSYLRQELHSISNYYYHSLEPTHASVLSNIFIHSSLVLVINFSANTLFNFSQLSGELEGRFSSSNSIPCSNYFYIVNY